MLLVVGIGCILFGIGGCNPGPPQDDLPPNLVIILADTLRASNLPVYGYPRDTAPNLSRLAAESVVFDHHFANYPGTHVSIGQMMTGRFSAPLMISAGNAVPALYKIEPDLLVLPRALQQRGYHTSLVSAHHWFDSKARILEYFDDVQVLPEPKDHPYASMQEVASRASRILRKRARKPKPFLLYIHTMDAHFPYRQQEQIPSLTGYGRSADFYDAQIRYMDSHIGELLKLVDDLDLKNRTVVAFTSDHGEDLGEMGRKWWQSGHGFTLGRSQIHVPLLIRIPGVAGRRWREITRHIDLAPTLLGLVDSSSLKDSLDFDGVDLSALIRSGEAGLKGLEGIAYTWRYWALHLKDRQVIYDQWNDRFSFSTNVLDERNYPRLKAQPPDEEFLALQAKLQAVMQRELRLRQNLPGVPLPSGPVGIPNWVVRSQVGDITSFATPTYENEDDGLWFLKSWLLLEAESTEEPEPITLRGPWIPGTFRVYARLSANGIESGFKNQFVIEVLGKDSRPRRVDGQTESNQEGLIDLGEHELGRSFVFRISEPQGGVSLQGFFITPTQDHEEPQVSLEVEKRLRALGYLE